MTTYILDIKHDEIDGMGRRMCFVTKLAQGDAHFDAVIEPVKYKGSEAVKVWLNYTNTHSESAELLRQCDRSALREISNYIDRSPEVLEKY